MKYLRLLLILLCCQAGFTASGQASSLSAVKCFAEAPADVLPLISRNTRLDMLDYFKAGSSRESANQFDGSCRILAVDSVGASSVVTFKMGEGLDCQIFVLNGYSADPLIGIIETVSTPISDSTVRLYNKNWEMVSSQLLPPSDVVLLPQPKLSDWLMRQADYAAVAEKLPFVMATYVFDPAKQQIVATHNMQQYYAQGEGDEVLKSLKPRLVYGWDGKTFKQKKK